MTLNCANLAQRPHARVTLGLGLLGILHVIGFACFTDVAWAQGSSSSSPYVTFSKDKLKQSLPQNYRNEPFLSELTAWANMVKDVTANTAQGVQAAMDSRVKWTLHCREAPLSAQNKLHVTHNPDGTYSISVYLRLYYRNTWGELAFFPVTRLERFQSYVSALQNALNSTGQPMGLNFQVYAQVWAAAENQYKSLGTSADNSLFEANAFYLAVLSPTDPYWQQSGHSYRNYWDTHVIAREYAYLEGGNEYERPVDSVLSLYSTASTFIHEFTHYALGNTDAYPNKIKGRAGFNTLKDFNAYHCGETFHPIELAIAWWRLGYKLPRSIPNFPMFNPDNDALNKENLYPLHFAIYRDPSGTTLSRLLDMVDPASFAEVSSINSYHRGFTPLGLAVWRGLPVGVIKRLLNRGALGSQAIFVGEAPEPLTITDQVLRRLGYEGIVNLLMSDSNLAKTPDAHNATPLHWVAHADYDPPPDNEALHQLQDIRQLLTKSQHMNPLSPSVAPNNTLIRVIMEDPSNSPLSQRLTNQRRILNDFSLNSHMRRKLLAELILKLAPNTLNVIDNAGNTPLHYASATLNSQLVQFFLSNRAIKDISNKNGQTPFDLANTQQKLLQDFLRTKQEPYKARYTQYLDSIDQMLKSLQP